ncbi:MAG TPA: hypothetical protein VJN96_05130 [Vicinamibacterales bacterium]|nr:hypothetical protein [Vicinamibacterales bacterium]
MRRVRIAIGLLLVFGLAGCGSSTAPLPTPLPMVQGHWQGSITSPTDGVGTITADLNQTGATVTGTVVLSQPGLPDAPGAFTGTLDSAAGAVTLKYTAFYDYHDGCTGTYGGTLDVSGNVLSGTYVGQNCAHGYTGSMRVEKSQ